MVGTAEISLPIPRPYEKNIWVTASSQTWAFFSCSQLGVKRYFIPSQAPSSVNPRINKIKSNTYGKSAVK